MEDPQQRVRVASAECLVHAGGVAQSPGGGHQRLLGLIGRPRPNVDAYVDDGQPAPVTEGAPHFGVETVEGLLPFGPRGEWRRRLPGRPGGPVLRGVANERHDEGRTVPLDDVDPDRDVRPALRLPARACREHDRPLADAQERGDPMLQILGDEVGEQPGDVMPERIRSQQREGSVVGGDDVQALGVGHHDRLAGTAEGRNRSERMIVRRGHAALETRRWGRCRGER